MAGHERGGHPGSPHLRQALQRKHGLAEERRWGWQGGRQGGEASGAKSGDFGGAGGGLCGRRSRCRTRTHHRIQHSRANRSVRRNSLCHPHPRIPRLDDRAQVALARLEGRRLRAGPPLQVRRSTVQAQPPRPDHPAAVSVRQAPAPRLDNVQDSRLWTSSRGERSAPPVDGPAEGVRGLHRLARQPPNAAAVGGRRRRLAPQHREWGERSLGGCYTGGSQRVLLWISGCKGCWGCRGSCSCSSSGGSTAIRLVIGVGSSCRRNLVRAAAVLNRRRCSTAGSDDSNSFASPVPAFLAPASGTLALERRMLATQLLKLGKLLGEQPLQRLFLLLEISLLSARQGSRGGDGSSLARGQLLCCESGCSRLYGISGGSGAGVLLCDWRQIESQQLLP